MQQPPPVSTLLAALAAFARTVAECTAGDVAWQTRPTADGWSLGEVMCHLRDVELEVHQARFRKLLAQEGAFLSGVDADEWAAERGYDQQNGRVARDEFLAARRETVALLAAIDETSLWQRQARHAFFGPTTLQELVYLAVQHDEVHLDQIEALLDR